MTPSRTMFEFFMTNDQKFLIENDTINLFVNLKFEKSPENSAAHEYQRFMVEKQIESAALQQKRKTLTDSTELHKADSRLYEITTEFKAKTDELIAGQKRNFVGQFIRAMQEIVVPEPPKDASGKILDSLFQYRYYRAHFFEHMKLNDARFLRTPLYEEKVKKYIEKVIPQIPDSVIGECDKLLTAAGKNPETFRYLLVTLFNHYASSTIMGFDAVYVHLAEDWYIPKATFSDTAFIRITRENVEKIKPVLLGKPAPPLRMLWVPKEHFIQAETDTVALNNPHVGSFIDLQQIDAKFTILAFWEVDCGICRKTIPELYAVYQKLKSKGVKAMAIHMMGGVEGKKKWTSFINEHEIYDWINVWNPYDFSYKKAYDIRSSSTIFVLDKDKKIIAKRLEPKQIEEFVNELISREEKSRLTKN
jgi:thiol-disulfide isomerase/thioredoxin